MLSFLDLLRQSVRLFDQSESLEIVDAVARLSTMGDRHIPKELVTLGIKMHVRGFLNTVAVQGNLDWVWPYWIERQFNPNGKSYIPRGHGLPQINLTHRNWTIIGALGNSHRAIVDPRSLITPWKDGWSLDYWIELKGHLYTPARLPSVKQRIHPQYPQVKTHFEVEKIAVKTCVFVTKVRDKHYLLVRVRLVNRGTHRKPLKFYFSLRPYNPEGISLIRHLEFKEDRLCLVNGHMAMILEEAPDRVYCSNYEEGDVSLIRTSKQTRPKISCEMGMATGLVEYTISLEPQAQKEYLALLTMTSDVPSLSPSSVLEGFNYQAVRRQFRDRWHDHLSAGAEVGFPDQNLTRSFMANRMYLQIFDRGQVMTPGALTYDDCWIRDSAFMIHALDKLGFHSQAREKLLHFPTRQSKDGFFNFQEGEWDANGSTIWVVVEHFRLTGDRELLAQLYPSLLRAAHWIERKRHKATKSPNGHAGLLPRGFSAEHLGPSDYYYWDNFWCLAGLKAVAFAAQTLGKKEDEQALTSYAHAYWKDIERTWGQSDQSSEVPFLPAAPGRRIDSGAIGSLCSVYPLKLIDPRHPRVQNTIRLIEDRYLIGQGFIQNHFHSGVNCYLSAQLAQCYLACGNPKAWDVVRYLLKCATPTYTWPEAIHPTTGGGCMGEGHHGWAAAEWILLLMNLLFVEKQGSLLITPLLQKEHLQAGTIFSVCNAPSPFGKINFILSVDKKEIWLELSNEFCLFPPESIIWRLPFSPSKVFFDDQAISLSSNTLRVPLNVSRVKVIL